MDQKSLEQLHQKYAELCAKYQQTVGKLQRQSIEHVGTNRLGLWAMQTQTAGVAVVDGGKILLANTAWQEVAEPRGRKQAFSMLSPSGPTKAATGCCSSVRTRRR
jgi:hypothetical protein